MVGCVQPAGESRYEYSTGEPGTSSSEDVGEEEKLDVMLDRLDTPSFDPDHHDEVCSTLDFLFVIDNSGSMSDNQMTLIANFSAFISGILNNIPTIEDFQVGIVTTDSYLHNVVECQSIGGLVVKTGGGYSSNMMCGPYAEGHNFMTPTDDLGVEFACAAQVGTGGSGKERPLAAVIGAMDGWLNSKDKCNEGFNRENDSVLVVVIITDEDDQSGGTLNDWYDHLVWLKGNQENEDDNIVILTLANTTDECGGFYGATRLKEFTNMFTYGFLGEICADDYGPFFDDATTWIEAACGGYTPEG